LGNRIIRKRDGIGVVEVGKKLGHFLQKVKTGTFGTTFVFPFFEFFTAFGF